MCATYLNSALNTAVATQVSGSYTAADFLTVANNAVREVLVDIDMRSFIRKTALAPNLFDDIYQYTCPTSIKGSAIIDIAPQVRRGRYDSWNLVTQEEFDRTKQDARWGNFDFLRGLYGNQSLEDNLVAFSEDDLTRKLLLSRVIDDSEIAIDRLDSVGDWADYGQGENITADADNYVKGSGSLNWDIGSGSGTTAGIYNDSLDTFDISDYLSNGSIFVWAYISSITYLTNFIIHIGSDASNYYYITIETNNEGNAFEAGWNLLRFDFANKTASNTPDVDACEYVALFMTKTTAKVSETDYRFDNLVMKLGKHYNVIFYSRYAWQAAGTWKVDSTAATDYLNVDTDEYAIVILKTSELIERHLKNHNEADRYLALYEKVKAKYILDNPSQKMLLSQEYYIM